MWRGCPTSAEKFCESLTHPCPLRGQAAELTVSKHSRTARMMPPENCQRVPDGFPYSLTTVRSLAAYEVGEEH